MPIPHEKYTRTVYTYIPGSFNCSNPVQTRLEVLPGLEQGSHYPHFFAEVIKNLYMFCHSACKIGKYGIAHCFKSFIDLSFLKRYLQYVFGFLQDFAYWFELSCDLLVAGKHHFHPRSGPSQESPFFYMPSHLSELKSFKSIISTHFPFIFIFKQCTT